MRIFIPILILFLLWLPATAAEPYTVGLPCPDKVRCQLPEAEAVYREIYERVGLEVQFIYRPGLREMCDANDMVIDGCGARSLVAISGYPNLLPVNESLVELEYLALTRTDTHVAGLEDLKGRKVAVLRSDVYATNMMEKAGCETVFVNSTKNGMDMLLEHRIEALISDTATNMVLEKSIPWERINVSAPLSAVKLYHAINRQHALLIPKLEQAIRSMKSDGTLKQLLGRFHILMTDEDN